MASEDEVVAPIQFTLRDAISPQDGMRVTFIERSNGVEIQPVWWGKDAGLPIVLDEQSTHDLHTMLGMWLSIKPGH